MTDEEWKNFPMIDGRNFSKYEVSSLGQIRNKESGYIFSDKPNSAGYVRNEFIDDEGKSKQISAHVIVIRAFIGEPESDDLTVDHINKKRADNRLVNLHWATAKQQRANSSKSNRRPKGQPVIQYSMKMKEIKRWTNITTAAKELGIADTTISTVCKEKLSSAGGYKWAYERQDLDGEIWRDYKPMDVQISNMGRIKSPCSHIVYGSKTGNGYMTYGKPGKLVHVMVAKTFLSNPKKKPEVNHKDKIGTNNKLENLEWATRSEQMIHSHRTNSNPNRYSTARAVKQYISSQTKANVEGQQDVCIGEYKSISEASKQTGCSVSGISDVCSGLLKSTKGFRFEYVDEDVLNRPALKCPKKVDYFIEDGNIIDVYDSVRSAALDLGISDKSIYNILRGAAKKTKDGYRFKYH